MFKNQGFSAVAIIIILALLVLGGGYWVWKDKAVAPAPVDTNIEPPISPPPAPLDTTNWKTYRNEEYGFEFQYPEGFLVTLTPHQAPHGTDLILGDKENSGPSNYDLGIQDSNKKYILGGGIFGFKIKDFDSPEFKHQLDVMIGGGRILVSSNLDSIKILEYPGEANKSNTSFVMQSSRNLYYIWYDFTNPYTSKILSTFRFTK